MLTAVESDEPVYTIGKLAEKFAISLRTLRFYEARGLLSPVRRGRQRRYSRKDAERLSAILKAKKLGFSLDEIRQMVMGKGSQYVLKLTREKCREQISVLEHKLAEITDALAELRRIDVSR